MPDKLKKGWTRVAFGDVVRLCRERAADPVEDGFDRYVGLEHLDPSDLKLRRWGNTADGTTFTSVFRAGQVLFGKRRAYQRKVALADFEGVCSGDIYVLETNDPKTLLPDLLPFICQTERFFEHAVGTSAGSLSPRTNWESLAAYEFALPPLDEQRRIAEVLGAADTLLQSTERCIHALTSTLSAHREAVFTNIDRDCSATRPGRTKCEWVVMPADEFCDSIADGTHATPKTVTGSGYPLVTSKNLKNERIDWQETYQISEIDYLEIKRRSWVEVGDILYGMIGTIGNPLILKESETAIAPKNVGIFRFGRNHTRSSFFFHALHCHFVQKQLAQQGAGSTQQFVGLGTLRSLLIPVPKNDADLDLVVTQLDLYLASLTAIRFQHASACSLKRHLFRNCFDSEAV